MNVPRLGAQLMKLADALGDAVVFSQGAYIVGCNAQACALFGYSQEEMQGLERKTLIAPDDARMARGIEQRKATGSFQGEVLVMSKGGRPVEVSLTSVAIVGDDGAEFICGVFRDLADRRRAEQADQALKESNELLHALTDAAFEAVLVHRDGVILTANRAAELASGVGPGELEGRKLLDFIALESIPTVMARVAQLDESSYSAFGRRADGTIYPVEVQARTGPVNVSGAPARVVALRDISARVALEEQFRQSQKMEAVGRLAGGVAHDFNNLLSVIMSCTSLAAAGLPPGDPAHEDLDEVLRAAERAAELTRQLLAFSRKQVLHPRVVELDEVVGRMESMVRRLIGEDVELRVVRQSGGRSIRADPGQLENMVMNLVVNARDSMPNGGTLTLSTSFMVSDEAWARTHLDMPPGAWVVLSVADTGTGMDAATKARIFEPFFTTKGPGRGTGLGLSTVFGIVRQAGGSIEVDSEPGHGTTFRVFLPVTSDAASAPGKAQAAPAVVPRGQRILLVEDEAQVGRGAAVVLGHAGFEVFLAANGAEALTRSAEDPGTFDLLLTDVVMPGLGGKQVADAICAQRPTTRVLYMSGYTTEKGLEPLLAKPFTPESLLNTVLEVLGR